MSLPRNKTFISWWASAQFISKKLKQKGRWNNVQEKEATQQVTDDGIF